MCGEGYNSAMWCSMAGRTEHGLQALHRSPTCAYICRLHASSAARTQRLLIRLRYFGGVTSRVSENLPRNSSRATLDPEHEQTANHEGPEILRGKANGRSVWYLLQSILCKASSVPPLLKTHRNDTLLLPVLDRISVSVLLSVQQVRTRCA